jgi:3-oxoadipyl-CoA thiolase
MSDAYICDFVRTPVGRYGGALSKVRTDDLGAIPLRELLRRHPTLGEHVEEVYFGCANQAGEDNRNVARMAVLLAGLPVSVPGITVNRLCASGLDAVGSAARAIRAGEIHVAFAGGVESMSRAPFVMGKSDVPFARDSRLYDTTIGWRFINRNLEAVYGVDSMPETGENVAEEFQVSRADQDAFALRSQQRAVRAQENGFLAKQIVAVEAPAGKGKVTVVDRDEHPRRDTTLEGLSALKPVTKPNGTVTAGNASGVNDGAAALLIASEEAIKKYGLTPRARILGQSSAAVPPRIMGVGPIPAVRKLCERLGISPSDFDAIEVNEAFASQALACLRDLGIPDDAEHVNPNGGAIAIGHPLGMTGARIVGAVLHQLEAIDAKYGLATMCVGVGQGAALAIERV